MEFSEFVMWANSYVLEEFLNSGLKGINNSIYTVIDNAVRNEKFGKNSQKKK